MARIGKTYPSPSHTLALEEMPKVKNGKRTINWTSRAIDTSRKDIRNWRHARAIAENSEEPSNFRLQTIYDNVFDDGHLTSQINNRISKSFKYDFRLLNKNGSENEKETLKLFDNVPWRMINRLILESIYFEYNLVQWKIVNGNLKIESLPRTNVVPQNGRFYPDLLNPTNFIKYQEEKEFGTWWLQLGNATKRGLINKAVPHVLMKSFSQSCWAELAEIYGIPPRFLKTNTQDASMLNRADKMMRDMGAAAYFIIDNTEEFSFAQGVNTNGDVYNNLMRVCNNEMSLLISGAVIGQDTQNGNYSKEESSKEVLADLVLEDLVLIEETWNEQIIPSLQRIGYINGDVKFEYDIPEDLEKLWQRVKDSMNNYEFDTDWLNEKFGLQITGVNQAPQFWLSAGESFFV